MILRKEESCVNPSIIFVKYLNFLLFLSKLVKHTLMKNLINLTATLAIKCHASHERAECRA